MSLGVAPGFGATRKLVRTISITMAKQMIFIGQNIKADETLRIGLVRVVYPQSELLNEAKKLAKSIAKNSKKAVKYSKQAINYGLEVETFKAIEIEEILFGECFENLEQKERMKKFLEKNKKNKNSSK